MNVIYFVDSNKTRSFRISVSRFRWLLGLGIFVLVWSLASPYLLSDAVLQRSQLKSRLHGAMATIFEYQVRYDGVYETSYPNSDELLSAAKENETNQPTEVANPKAVIAKRSKSSPRKTTVKKETKKISTKKSSLAAKAARKKTKTAEKLATVGSSDTSFNVKIESTKVKVKSGQVNLSFAIRNGNSPRRAEGFVFGVAEYQLSDGGVRYVPSPSSMQVDAKTGEPKNPKEAFRYSIRYYKAKDLIFSPPAGVSGSYKSIRLVVLSKEGESSTVMVDVPKEKITIPEKVQAPPAPSTLPLGAENEVGVVP